MISNVILRDTLVRMSRPAGKLKGRLDGVQADPRVATLCEAMDTLADSLGKCIHSLLGPVLATKLRRFARHLLPKLLDRGNLWGGGMRLCKAAWLCDEHVLLL